VILLRGEGDLVAEAQIDELNVVVDGFGDADDCDVAASSGGFLRGAHGTANGAVAADDGGDVIAVRSV
jgi:hypothetical protein